jgi:hypothetical protein
LPSDCLSWLRRPFIQNRATPEQLASNVLLSAIPFILIFVAIILFFITLIVLIATALSNNISVRAYRIVESILIAGIILGIVGMFQPWLFEANKYGFLVLLFSTLSFIVWSHVSPRREEIQEEVGPVSVSDIVRTTQD